MSDLPQWRYGNERIDLESVKNIKRGNDKCRQSFKKIGVSVDLMQMTEEKKSLHSSRHFME